MSVSADRVLASLRALEQRSPAKQFHQAVAVPKCIAFDTPPVEAPVCLACRVATTLGHSPSLHPSAVDRSGLIHSRGIPLKVWLTVYRWGRPYKRLRKDQPVEAYVHQAVARLRLADLASQALGEHAT